jgi:thiol-disulfide isomerase/thioredoxin
MTRRALIFGVAGVAAAALGVGSALWRGRSEVTGDGSAGGDGAETDPGDLWGRRFARPEGGDLVMADFRGRPLLLNFWATWCPPCVKEMPLLDQFHRRHQAAGWQVVGLAVDAPTPVRQFLTRVPVGFSIGLAGLEGTDLSRRLGNPGGALPFTVVFGKDGRVLHRKLGEVTLEELDRWAAVG